MPARELGTARAAVRMAGTLLMIIGTTMIVGGIVLVAIALAWLVLTPLSNAVYFFDEDIPSWVHPPILVGIPLTGLLAALAGRWLRRRTMTKDDLRREALASRREAL